MVFLTIGALHRIGTISNRDDNIGHALAPAVAVQHSANA